MVDRTRRKVSRLLGASLLLPLSRGPAGINNPAPQKGFRIRTITAGVPLNQAQLLAGVEKAIDRLRGLRLTLEAEGYEVQTLRIATQPLAEYLPDWSSPGAAGALRALDRMCADNGVLCSIGPVITVDVHIPAFASWAKTLVENTTNISFSVNIAAATDGVHGNTARSAAEAIVALSRTGANGSDNFRFAASACVPAGTPFFPAAFFTAPDSFSIGLESPGLLETALRADDDLATNKARLRRTLQAELKPLERRARHAAQALGWNYLGIDVSPAPGPDASIGRAIERFTGRPFGDASTLAACAGITDVLQGLEIKTCGYSGLMLPVLEDPVLAQRAGEGRYGIAELLLYSSVCGTGLDVVPIPGDTPVSTVARIVGDVAALAAKYQKPLSARLFPVPGKGAGERVRFDNPHLTDATVMRVD